MTDEFVGEIRIVGFNFAPQYWALCNGQVMPIQQNTALFSLLGTQYGGNGKSNFALPNLQGRVAMGQGQGAGLMDRSVGDTGGSESVTLGYTEMPAHTHAVTAQSSRADRANARGSKLAQSVDPIYSTAAPGTQLHPTSVSVDGGNQPHNNMQPYLAMNFIIALAGTFPARS